MGEAALVNEALAEPVLRVRGFCKRYRRRSAVEGVDLTCARGEIYGLIGPDGAGKSSLMKALAGVLAFEAGRIEVFGVNIDSERAAEKVKDRIGFMPQGLGLNLYPELTVEENVDFFAQLRQVPAPALAERKQRLLKITRLAAFRARPMKQLSGGMKQKLGLVCTLIHEPALLILDEPTTGVDPVSRRDFWAILTGLLRERGITALISTAYLDEASRFHRLSLLYQGRLLDQGTPEQILARTPGSLIEFEAMDAGRILSRLRETFAQVEGYGARMRVFVPGCEPAQAKIAVTRALDGQFKAPLRSAEPELEDAFIALLNERGLVADDTRLRLPTDPGPVSDHQGQAVIEARGLCRDFGDFRAVDQVSFRVRRGGIFGLLGANGAGKTTVIKLLTGILHPSDGSGRVADADMRGAGQTIKARIGYMSQAFSLYQDLSALENIRLYAGIYGLDRKTTAERTAWVIAMAGLGGFENTLAGQLPLGVRQRLALGCALVHRPRVLFLDEPTSGVDPIGRRRFWEILFHLSRRDGVTILLTTHYMSEAEHCDQLALMHAGRIVADASPQAMILALQAEAGQLLELEVERPLEALALLEHRFEGVGLFGRRIHLFASSPDAAEATIRTLMQGAGIRLTALRARTPAMEDVFVYRVLALERGQGAP